MSAPTCIISIDTDLFNGAPTCVHYCMKCQAERDELIPFLSYLYTTFDGRRYRVIPTLCTVHYQAEMVAKGLG